jgi:mannose-6-phosphate isomerase-like protein (cupin superfamily)
MKFIDKLSVKEACGTKPKLIQEFIGMVNPGTSDVSIAKMESPHGWEEPGQTPEFDEYTVVLKGTLCVKTREESLEVKKGQSVIAEKGKCIQYNTPYESGAEYISVCLPAFTPQAVHRDKDWKLELAFNIINKMILFSANYAIPYPHHSGATI